MGVFRCLILLKVIAYIEAVKPKSVNVALETVLEFNNKETDVKFLDNVQQFLDKVNTVIRPDKTARRFASENKNVKFTDFIRTAIDILKTYDDDDLEDTFAVIDNEIRKYHYRGCKFYELVEDQNVRRFVANKLDDLKEKPASKLRKNLDNALKAIEESKFSEVQAEFFEYLNSLYRQDSKEKLKTFLKNLQTYSTKSKRANLNLIKIVRDGLRSIIFDHYSALNANARRDFKIRLESSWSDFKHPEKYVHNVWTNKYTDMDTDIKTSKAGHAKDIKQKTTAPTVKLRKLKDRYDTSSEPSNLETEKLTYAHEKLKKKSKKHKSSKIKKHKINNHKPEIKKELTMITFSVSSDSEEKILPKHQKHKSSHKKYRDSKKKSPVNKKTKPAKPKKHRSKKLSSFITLYPEEFTPDTKNRFQIEHTTRKSKLYTLWEEKFKQKKRKNKKHIKRKSSKDKTNLKINAEHPALISEYDTVINVEKETPSSSENNNKRRFKIDSLAKSTTKHHVWQMTKTTEYEPETHQKFRKYISKETFPSEEGISIESYEIERRSLTEKPINISVSELKQNVLRRINNLERQMEEVKYKIDTKLPTGDENTSINETQFEPSQFFEGVTVAISTEKDTISDSTTTNLSTTLNTEVLLNVTHLKIMVSDMVGQSDSNNTKNTDNSDKMGDITDINRGAIQNISDRNQNNTISEERTPRAAEDFNNEIGIDLFDNMKKHNNSDYNNNLDTSVKPVHFDEFYDDLAKLQGEEKPKEVITESDSTKILDETTKANSVNELKINK